MLFDSIIFSYGHNIVLRGIYLKIPHGSVIGLFGVNGSGKSTIIKIGAGKMIPQNGNVFISDECYDKAQIVNRYNHIAYLPQESFLPSDLTILALEKYIPGLKSVVDTDPLLKKLKNQKVTSLSGGELRYLEINLLFSLNRKYYLLDEPFTGVEPNLIDKICELLNYQKGIGKGILLTDHYYRYVTEIVDKAYLLKDGYVKELRQIVNLYPELIENGYLPNR